MLLRVRPDLLINTENLLTVRVETEPQEPPYYERIIYTMLDGSEYVVVPRSRLVGQPDHLSRQHLDQMIWESKNTKVLTEPVEVE